MNDVTLAITILWGFILFYAVIASIDFGAGFWSMIYMNRRKMAATSLANRYLSPTWEVTNVFIVLIVVGMFSFFPGATRLLGSLILLPGSFMLILLALRSAFLVFSHSVQKLKTVLIWVSGLTGVFIPALLILILPISQGLFISDNGKNVPTLDFGALISTPSFYAFVGFAMLNTCFISSLLLLDYARLAKDENAFRSYYKNVVWLAPITLLFALFILLSIQHDSPWLFSKLLVHRWALIFAGILFLLSYMFILLTSRYHDQLSSPYPRLAMAGIAVHYLLAGYAYGRSHLPYLIFPYVTLKQGFTDPATFHALSFSYIIGAAILIPGFIYFWRLFLKDRRYIEKQEHSE